MSLNKNLSTQTALVTGANAGLGFETAAQLAEMGYGRIILATRTHAKGTDAKQRLIERTGKDVFDLLAIDVAEVQVVGPRSTRPDRPTRTNRLAHSECRIGFSGTQAHDRRVRVNVGSQPRRPSRVNHETARSRQFSTKRTYRHFWL